MAWRKYLSGFDLQTDDDSSDEARGNALVTESLVCDPKHEAGTFAAVGPARKVIHEVAVFVRIALAFLLVAFPVSDVKAQFAFARRFAACRCDPGGGAKKPRFLLPVAGGLGFLPIAAAARDSQLPTLALPSLVDIRDNSPRNALEGERALEMGALAPDTATALPTMMLISAMLLGLGVSFIVPRRRRRALAFWRRPGGRPRGGWRLRTIHRRRIGGVLAASGGLLLVLGSREYAEGAEAQRRARAEWLRIGSTVVRINDDAETSATTPVSAPVEIDPRAIVNAAVPNVTAGSAVPLPLLATSGREIRRGAPVARLVIPAIDLDEIVLEGVGPVELNGGPGHFPGSVLPGEAGNSIVSAHRDRHFRRVGELSVGSRIRTETRKGSLEWVITERRIISRDTPSLFEESAATLTLTTCWPLRYFGPAPDRLLIIAKPVT
jgi:LPXTG-site transpeptidase (sortase) family protein